MAQGVGGIYIFLDADLQKLAADFDRAGSMTENFGRRADRAVSGSQRAIDNVIGAVRLRAVGATSSLGLLGDALSGIGTKGLAIGAIFGAGFLAFNKIKDGAKELREFSKEVRDAGEQSGLATDQLQGFTDVAQHHGVELDRATQALVKFNVERGNAASGSGKLYDELRRINPVLAEQFAAARSTADALAIFTSAMTKADGATQSLLARAAFGRGGAGLVATLNDIAGQGGLGAVTQAALKSGEAIDSAIIKKQAEAAVEAERRSRIVENNWNQAAGAIWEKWKELKNLIGLGPENEIKISIAVKEAANSILSLSKRPISSLQDELATIDRQIEETRGKAAKVAIPVPAGLDPEEFFARRKAQLRISGVTSNDDASVARANLDEMEARAKALREELALRKANRDIALQEGETPSSALGQNRDDAARDALERRVKVERERLGILGQTATVDEMVKAKEDDLTLAILNGANITRREKQRIVDAYKLQLDAAREQTRERLGLASKEEMVEIALRQLAEDRKNGVIRNEAEMTEARRLALKTIDENYKNLKVRVSDTPALTRLSQDASDLRANLDEGLSGALRGISSDLFDLAKGTVTAAQGLTNLALRFGEAIAQALIMKSIVGPLAGFISTGVSSFFGGSNPTNVGSATAFQKHFGGDVSGTGMRRTISLGAVASAPRFHQGLTSREFLSVLEKGERVLTERMSNRTDNVIAGLSAASSVPALVTGSSPEIHIHEAPGVSASVQTSQNGQRTDIILRQVDDAMHGLITGGRSRTNAALEARYGLDRTKGMG